ncbi:MAG TPA: DUF1360 domain-containing protein [Anaerolineaceae bacterium]|jgi:hypothetical protein|nr:DUF1360 domain-containing protein [Anaerolineaceae bacterium]
MDNRAKPSRSQEYLAKLILTGVFLSGLALFIIWRRSTGQDLAHFQLSAIDLILLGFATLRLGRLIAYDLVTEPLRSPFTRTVPDETGAGDSVEPKNDGWRLSIGQLISCPICSGTWAGAALVAGLYAWPGPARLFITILAAVGVAEVLNALIESLSWSGQLARTRSGEILKKARAEQGRIHE